MRKRALVDILVLAVVFWAVWALRFAGVKQIGIWTMLAGVGTAAVVIVWRKESWPELGVRAGGDVRFVLSRAGEFAMLTLVTGGVVIALATAFGHPPTQSSVLTEQPDTLVGFLLDIVIGVWLAAAIGEELFFRGFLLSKFETLFGGQRPGLTFAVLAQAVWFGAGHASQGVSGMIMTGAIGAVVGAFFLARARRSLLPLIVGHGLVDTVTLTINYFG